MINGLDILVLLELSLQEGPRMQSRKLAEDLFISPSEVSASLKRCKAAGLIYWSDAEKRVNRTGLVEFLSHGLRYVFPAARGSLTRGIPTASAASPLNAHFQSSVDPPPVWPYAEGSVRGIALKPLHRQAPRAALHDARLYELLALVDAIRGERVRERGLAIEEIAKRLLTHHE